MIKEKEYQLLRDGLLKWFAGNQRDLPWRRTYDPYHVWISEIMLQQTQMERGVEYFNRWLEKFVKFLKVDRCVVNEFMEDGKTVHRLLNYTVPDIGAAPVLDS